MHDCWSRSRGNGLDRNKDAVNRVHKILGSDISSRIDALETGRPVAEVLVEGELSPFEHEALYQLLKKHFRLEQPDLYRSESTSRLFSRALGGGGAGLGHGPDRTSNRYHGADDAPRNDGRASRTDRSNV